MEKKALGYYHNTYLKTHALLLADVFETFRETCLKHYKLDPAHFYTAPGLAWQALLKTAAEYCEHEKRRKDCELCLDEFRLELLTDRDMLLMLEKGIRGGITQAVKRYAKTNNKEGIIQSWWREHISPVCWYKQRVRMGNGSKTTNKWIFMKEGRRLYPWKNRWTCQKRHEGISFIGRCRVS